MMAAHDAQAAVFMEHGAALSAALAAERQRGAGSQTDTVRAEAGVQSAPAGVDAGAQAGGRSADAAVDTSGLMASPTRPPFMPTSPGQLRPLGGGFHAAAPWLRGPLPPLGGAAAAAAAGGSLRASPPPAPTSARAGTSVSDEYSEDFADESTAGARASRSPPARSGSGDRGTPLTEDAATAAPLPRPAAGPGARHADAHAPPGGRVVGVPGAAAASRDRRAVEASLASAAAASVVHEDEADIEEESVVAAAAGAGAPARGGGARDASVAGSVPDEAPGADESRASSVAEEPDALGGVSFASYRGRGAPAGSRAGSAGDASVASEVELSGADRSRGPPVGRPVAASAASGALGATGAPSVFAPSRLTTLGGTLGGGGGGGGGGEAAALALRDKYAREVEERAATEAAAIDARAAKLSSHAAAKARQLQAEAVVVARSQEALAGPGGGAAAGVDAARLTAKADAIAAAAARVAAHAAAAQADIVAERADVRARADADLVALNETWRRSGRNDKAAGARKAAAAAASFASSMEGAYEEDFEPEASVASRASRAAAAPHGAPPRPASERTLEIRRELAALGARGGDPNESSSEGDLAAREAEAAEQRRVAEALLVQRTRLAERARRRAALEVEQAEIARIIAAVEQMDVGAMVASGAAAAPRSSAPAPALPAVAAARSSAAPAPHDSVAVPGLPPRPTAAARAPPPVAAPAAGATPAGRSLRTVRSMGSTAYSDDFDMSVTGGGEGEGEGDVVEEVVEGSTGAPDEVGESIAGDAATALADTIASAGDVSRGPGRGRRAVGGGSGAASPVRSDSGGPEAVGSEAYSEDFEGTMEVSSMRSPRSGALGARRVAGGGGAGGGTAGAAAAAVAGASLSDEYSTDFDVTMGTARSLAAPPRVLAGAGPQQGAGALHGRAAGAGGATNLDASNASVDSIGEREAAVARMAEELRTKQAQLADLLRRQQRQQRRATAEVCARACMCMCVMCVARAGAVRVGTNLTCFRPACRRKRQSSQRGSPL